MVGFVPSRNKSFRSLDLIECESRTDGFLDLDRMIALFARWISRDGERKPFIRFDLVARDAVARKTPICTRLQIAGGLQDTRQLPLGPLLGPSLSFV
jgi:hypothetical protein